MDDAKNTALGPRRVQGSAGASVLRELVDGVLALGDSLSEQIKRLRRVIAATTPDTAGDIEASRTAERDINAADNAMRSRCVRYLVMYTPSATDFRLAISIIEMVPDLERIGDEISNAIEEAAKMHERGVESSQVPADLWAMVSGIERQLTNCIVAWRDRDMRLAAEVYKADKEIDRLFEAMLIPVSQGLRAEGSTTDNGNFSMFRIARCFERVGDHIKNVLEHLVWEVKGKDIRHGDVDVW